VTKKAETMANEAIACFSVFRMLFGVFNTILDEKLHSRIMPIDI
jgi:hypothetical protein